MHVLLGNLIGYLICTKLCALVTMYLDAPPIIMCTQYYYRGFHFFKLSHSEGFTSQKHTKEGFIFESTPWDGYAFETILQGGFHL